jgi:hypothetical protein
VSGTKLMAKFTAKITSAGHPSVQPVPELRRWIEAKPLTLAE